MSTAARTPFPQCNLAFTRHSCTLSFLCKSQSSVSCPRSSVLLTRLQYARRMGQPTQRATNYTARSNIDTAQSFLHAKGQRPKRAMIRQRSRRRQRRGEPLTEHGLGVAQNISHSHSGIDEKRPTEKCVPLQYYCAIYDLSVCMPYYRVKANS